MSDNNRFKQPWTIWTHAKLGLTGEEWKENPGNRPGVKFKIHNNNPRFNMYLNDGKYDKAIGFNMDPFIIQEIFEVIRRTVASQEPDRTYWELLSGWDHRGNKTDKPGPVAKIFVGRDSDGVVYIAFQAKGESLAKFPFVPSYYASLHGADGEKLCKKKASEIRAIAWVKGLDAIIGPFMAVHGKEPEQKPGSGGGGNQNKSGNWGKPKSDAGGSSGGWGDDVAF